jgi:hypothetical protein
MKRYAYLTKSNGAYRLIGFDDRQPVAAPDGQAAIMASRLDYDVQIIELPAMADKEVEGFLTYRIRSLYPGHPEQTVFDYRLLARGGKRYAVLFLVQREILEECRLAAGGRPLFSSFSILLPLLGPKRSGGDLICLFWHDAWLEALVLREGEPPRSFASKRSRDASADLNQVLSLAAADKRAAEYLVVCPEEEQAALRELLASRQPDSGALTVLSTPQALRRLAKGPEPLFERRKTRPVLPRSLRLQLAVALIILLSFLALKRAVDRDAARLAGLRRSLQDAQGRSTQVVALQTEIDTLKKQLSALRRERPPDPYWVLAELRTVLGPGTRINSFVMERGFFQMEAVGSNPLRLMEIFKARASFENVKLIQIVPLKDTSRELFRITGTAHAQ